MRSQVALNADCKYEFYENIEKVPMVTGELIIADDFNHYEAMDSNRTWDMILACRTLERTPEFCVSIENDDRKHNVQQARITTNH